MKGLHFPIAFATALAVFYTISSHWGIGTLWIILMFSISPIVVIWLAIHIMKYGEPSTKTWDEGHRYEDRDV